MVKALSEERDFPRFIGIFVVLFCIAIRLILAAVPGHESDSILNRGWALSAARYGVVESYQHQIDPIPLPNNPPLTLFALSAVGHALDALQPSFLWQRLLLKLPGILFDGLTCMLLLMLCIQWKGRNVGMLTAFLYAIHPGILFDSAIWGQTDSIYTFFVLLALAGCLWQRWALVGISIALAVLTKAQAIIFLPIIFVLLVSRPKALLVSFISALATTCIVLLPFALQGALGNVLWIYVGSVGYYPSMSLSAYNLWWALLGVYASGTLDTTTFFHIFTARTTGVLLFLLALCISLYRERKHFLSNQVLLPSLLYIASLTSFSFFLLCTQMHERYLYPFFTLGLPLVFLSQKIAWTYFITSVLFTLNLLAFHASSENVALIGRYTEGSIAISWLMIAMYLVWNIVSPSESAQKNAQE